MRIVRGSDSVTEMLASRLGPRWKVAAHPNYRMGCLHLRSPEGRLGAVTWRVANEAVNQGGISHLVDQIVLQIGRLP